MAWKPVTYGVRAALGATLLIPACGRVEGLIKAAHQPVANAPAGGAALVSPTAVDASAVDRNLAATYKGHGGQALVCRNVDGSVKSIDFLDFFEARVLRNVQIDLGAADLDPTTKARSALLRFSHLDYAMASSADQMASAFNGSTRFVDSNLTLADDVGAMILDPDCGMEQLFTAQDAALPFDQPVTVNNRLWPLLTNDQKAGVILHLSLYPTIASWGVKDDSAARYLTELIASHQLDSYTTDQWNALKTKLQGASGNDTIWLDTQTGVTFLFPNATARSFSDATTVCNKLNATLAEDNPYMERSVDLNLETHPGFKDSDLLAAIGDRYVLYSRYSYDDYYLELKQFYNSDLRYWSSNEASSFYFLCYRGSRS